MTSSPATAASQAGFKFSRVYGLGVRVGFGRVLGPFLFHG